jgi:hypothetical protein
MKGQLNTVYLQSLELPPKVNKTYDSNWNFSRVKRRRKPKTSQTEPHITDDDRHLVLVLVDVHVKASSHSSSKPFKLIFEKAA